MAVDVIKVCGITSIADALFAAQNGATALGFVFFGGSPRCVRIDTAAMISAVLPKDVLRVGVFVNESAAQVRNTAKAAQLDVVQLHGDETPEYCTALGDMRIWKAFQVREFFKPDMIEPVRLRSLFVRRGCAGTGASAEPAARFHGPSLATRRVEDVLSSPAASTATTSPRRFAKCTLGGSIPARNSNAHPA